MEGGSFDVDGEGTALTTSECLLNPNRNPDCTRPEIERYLVDHLGVEQVVWIPRGVHLDETDGHVDNMARFIAPGVVVLTWTHDTSDPQYERSAPRPSTILRSTTDAQGRSLEVVLLHQPGPLYIGRTRPPASTSSTGRVRPRRGTLAGSYVNCYIGNDIVVVPVFDDPHDDAALATYAAALPGPPGRARSRPRDPARRRQRPLRHPAGPPRLIPESG